MPLERTIVVVCLVIGSLLALRWINRSDTILGINLLNTITLTVESAANDALHSVNVVPKHLIPNIGPSASSICTKLASKRVLFLGPSLTFAMHHHLLSHVSESPPHTCLGPEFCTFHHICLLSPPDTATPTLKKPDRHRKPPSPRDLFLTRSALVHYIQSSALRPPAPNTDHPAYSAPTIDPQNGVRVKETYWLGPARRADMLVLHRGPASAPAWTYDGSADGNWSFVNSLPYVPRLARLLPHHMSPGGLRALSVVNAAATVTLAKFLPEVVRTLSALRSDAGTKLKPIVWHGSVYRFQRSRCERSSIEGDLEIGMDAAAYLAGVLDGGKDDPWDIYHDTQVYLQERILRLLLPHWDIIFLPLDIASTDQTSDIETPGPTGGLERPCDRCCREEARMTRDNFLGGLGFILDALSNG